MVGIYIANILTGLYLAIPNTIDKLSSLIHRIFRIYIHIMFKNTPLINSNSYFHAVWWLFCSVQRWLVCIMVIIIRGLNSIRTQRGLDPDWVSSVGRSSVKE